MIEQNYTNIFQISVPTVRDGIPSIYLNHCQSYLHRNFCLKTASQQHLVQKCLETASFGTFWHNQHDSLNTNLYGAILVWEYVYMYNIFFRSRSAWCNSWSALRNWRDNIWQTTQTGNLENLNPILLPLLSSVAEIGLWKLLTLSMNYHYN